MKKSHLIPLTLILLAAAPGTVKSAVHCVRSDAAGSGSGGDWTNAYTELPADLVRGDTYYIADGTYPGHTFDDAEADSLYIRIVKATPEAHGTDTGWNDAYGDGTALFDISWVFTSSYWVLDGVTGGGPGSWDAGHGFKIKADAPTRSMILLGHSWLEDTPHYLELRHIELEHQGMDTEEPDDGIYLAARQVDEPEGLGSRHITISHCYLHDFGRMPLNTGFARHWVFEYNLVTRNSSSTANHAEGWQDFGSDSMVVRYNIFRDLEGTAAVAMKKNYNAVSEDWAVYGNVFYTTDGNPFDRGGFGGEGVYGATTCNTDQQPLTGHSRNIKFFNNTIVNISANNCGVKSYLDTDDFHIHNNLWYNCTGTLIGFGDGNDHDYNWFADNWSPDAGCTSPPCALYPGSGSYGMGDVPEPHQQLGDADPFTNWSDDDFSLLQATEPGTTLAAPYNTDMFGNVRGEDGTWDRGAIEFVRSAVSDFEERSADSPFTGMIPNPIVGSTEHMRMISILGGSAGSCGIALVKSGNGYVKRVVLKR